MKEISSKSPGLRTKKIVSWRRLKSSLSYYEGYSTLINKFKKFKVEGTKKALQIIKNRETRDCTTTKSPVETVEHE